jgi:tetratricopeptide (TPR) repeat protein
VGSKEERVVQELLKQGREALARGESVAAMKAFEAVQQKDPGNVEAIEGMTQAGIQMGMQFSRVFGQGNSELDADATRKVKDLLQKARDQMAKGDAEAAMKTYEAVLEIDATNSDAHRGIGKAAAQMSRDARNKARQTARPTTPPSP